MSDEPSIGLKWQYYPQHGGSCWQNGEQLTCKRIPINPFHLTTCKIKKRRQCQEISLPLFLPLPLSISLSSTLWSLSYISTQLYIHCSYVYIYVTNMYMYTYNRYEELVINFQKSYVLHYLTTFFLSL